MDGIGETTSDIITIDGTHPAETGLSPEDTEKGMQAQSRRWTFWGWFILGTSVAAALSIAALDPNLIDTPAEMVFGCLALMCIWGAGIHQLTAAWAERLNRPERILIRAATMRAATNGAIAEQSAELARANAQAINELRRSIAEITEALGRQHLLIGGLMYPVDRARKELGQEIDGLRTTVEQLVKQMPIEFERKYWRGWNEAAQEFIQTGTDQAAPLRTRSAHLGLVPPTDS